MNEGIHTVMAMAILAVGFFLVGLYYYELYQELQIYSVGLR